MAAPRNELEAALKWLHDQTTPMETLLAELVNQNSHTANRDGGNRVGAILREALAGTSLACTVVPSSSFADHLVFSTSEGGSPVALVGHLDTVFPPNTFEGYRRDGELAHGPGVLDMKGGLVVIALSALALHHVGALARLPLRIVIVSDEEVGSPEGQLVIRAHAELASCGLVFEAGRKGDAVVMQRKGTGSLIASATGRAAHAGNLHHEGVNAIWALALFVDRAQRLTDYGLGSTVNVGKIEGGESRNTVPDSARAELDLRFTTRAEGATLLDRLHRLSGDIAQAVPGATVTLSGGISRDPLELTRASEGLYREYAACASAAGLGVSMAPLVGGGSDANTLSALGIASIDGLGPRGTGFHTRQECIELGTLLPKAEALTRFLLGRTARA